MITRVVEFQGSHWLAGHDLRAWLADSNNVRRVLAAQKEALSLGHDEVEAVRRAVSLVWEEPLREAERIQLHQRLASNAGNN